MNEVKDRFCSFAVFLKTTQTDHVTKTWKADKRHNYTLPSVAAKTQKNKNRRTRKKWNHHRRRKQLGGRAAARSCWELIRASLSGLLQLTRDDTQTETKRKSTDLLHSGAGRLRLFITISGSESAKWAKTPQGSQSVAQAAFTTNGSGVHVWKLTDADSTEMMWYGAASKAGRSL